MSKIDDQQIEEAILKVIDQTDPVVSKFDEAAAIHVMLSAAAIMFAARTGSDADTAYRFVHRIAGLEISTGPIFED